MATHEGLEDSHTTGGGEELSPSTLVIGRVRFPIIGIRARESNEGLP